MKKKIKKARRKSRMNVNTKKLQKAAQQYIDAFYEDLRDNDQDELMDKIKNIYIPVKV